MARSLQEDIENDELKLFDFFPKIIASFVYNFILKPDTNNHFVRPFKYLKKKAHYIRTAKNHLSVISSQ